MIWFFLSFCVCISYVGCTSAFWAGNVLVYGVVLLCSTIHHLCTVPSFPPTFPLLPSPLPRPIPSSFTCDYTCTYLAPSAGFGSPPAPPSIHSYTLLRTSSPLPIYRFTYLPCVPLAFYLPLPSSDVSSHPHPRPILPPSLLLPSPLLTLLPFIPPFSESVHSLSLPFSHHPYPPTSLPRNPTPSSAPKAHHSLCIPAQSLLLPLL